MKSTKVLPALFILTHPLFITSALSEEPIVTNPTTISTSVIVNGDITARAMCRAVIIDNPVILNKKIREYHKASAVLNAYVDKDHNRIDESFTCNNQTLLEFADAIGAKQVSEYLAYRHGSRPTVSVEIAAR